MAKKAIFIAATGQNVGKTTLCLGLIAALKKRFDSIGFIKPVGQQHVQIDDHINVDKDAVLFKEHFHLLSNWQDMSPVIFPPGFTRQYLDEEITEEEMTQKILEAFHNIYSKNDYTVVEGTGHVGVGSIVNMNNAKIASLLGLDMVIIASGGLGSAIDELALNIEMCRKYNVGVRGVILNKVHSTKREMILKYVPRALEQWNIPLIGCVPYDAFLSYPTIKDYENLFKGNLLGGSAHRMRHFNKIRLVAGSLDSYKNDIHPNELIITPASRCDIIAALLEKNAEAIEKTGHDLGCGLILTSNSLPSEKSLELIKTVNIPTLLVPAYSFEAMKLITSFNAKIRWEDTEKVEEAIKIVEANINFESLCGVESFLANLD